MEKRDIFSEMESVSPNNTYADAKRDPPFLSSNYKGLIHIDWMNDSYCEEFIGLKQDELFQYSHHLSDEYLLSISKKYSKLVFDIVHVELQEVKVDKEKTSTRTCSLNIPTFLSYDPTNKNRFIIKNPSLFCENSMVRNKSDDWKYIVGLRDDASICKNKPNYPVKDYGLVDIVKKNSYSDLWMWRREYENKLLNFFAPDFIRHLFENLSKEQLIWLCLNTGSSGLTMYEYIVKKEYLYLHNGDFHKKELDEKCANQLLYTGIRGYTEIEKIAVSNGVFQYYSVIDTKYSF